MTEPRIIIRLRYEPTGNGYRVVLDGRVIGTHETKEKAAIAIRNVGGRRH